MSPDQVVSAQLIIVGRVCAEYRKARLHLHGQGHWHRRRAVIELLEEEYGDLPANQFGSKRMHELRTNLSSGATVASSPTSRFASSLIS